MKNLPIQTNAGIVGDSLIEADFQNAQDDWLHAPCHASIALSGGVAVRSVPLVNAPDRMLASGEMKGFSQPICDFVVIIQAFPSRSPVGVATRRGHSGVVVRAIASAVSSGERAESASEVTH
jgi:hypothetical protein